MIYIFFFLIIYDIQYMIYIYIQYGCNIVMSAKCLYLYIGEVICQMGTSPATVNWSDIFRRRPGVGCEQGGPGVNNRLSPYWRT